MFYLLEDNRIIDTSKALHNVDEIIIEENENEKYLYLVGWLGKHFCGKIKNQSENVLDLIEKGDLVRCLNDIYEIKCVYHTDDSFVTDFVTSGCGICFPSWGKFLKEFNAIYKPDRKGNYIKVWERKEENE